MRIVNSFEQELKTYFDEQTKKVEVSKDMMNNIKKEINDNQIKKSFKLTKRKLAITFAVCILTVTCSMAATKLNSWTSHSSAESKISEYPSSDEVQKILGYTPKYLKSLPNGFEFKEANPVAAEGKDVDGNTIVRLNELKIYYERENKNDGEILTLSISKKDKNLFNDQISSISNLETITDGNSNLYYSESLYKAVPEDYELTEEDKQLMEQGKLDIGYGTDKVEAYTTQFINWYDEGIGYDILGMNTNITKDEMVDMAKAIINEAN